MQCNWQHPNNKRVVLTRPADLFMTFFGRSFPYDFRKTFTDKTDMQKKTLLLPCYYFYPFLERKSLFSKRHLHRRVFARSLVSVLFLCSCALVPVVQNHFRYKYCIALTATNQKLMGFISHE